MAVVVRAAPGGGYIRLHTPPPAESWQRAELWRLLEERAQIADLAISFEYSVDGDRAVSAVDVFAVQNDLGLRWRLRPVDWVGDPYEEISVEVHARDGRPPGQALLTHLGLGRVQRAVETVLTEPAPAAILGERWGAKVARRPGRRKRDDLYYAMVALDYRRSLELAPANPIPQMAAKSGDTPDQLRARVRRARDRGLLTRGRPGKAGGELTSKAITELVKANLIETEDDYGKR